MSIPSFQSVGNHIISLWTQCSHSFLEPAASGSFTSQRESDGHKGDLGIEGEREEGEYNSPDADGGHFGSSVQSEFVYC
jgi:hypothetical protein